LGLKDPDFKFTDHCPSSAEERMKYGPANILLKPLLKEIEETGELGIDSSDLIIDSSGEAL